jgi:hypothetical protein
MSDIFISYAHQDRPRAQTLAQTLEDSGWSTFWDRTIPTGKTWRETIGRELADAHCVIVLWSKASIESEWVQEEGDDAKRRRILVPVLIENVQPPIGFRAIQTADLADWDGKEPTQAFRRLVTDITALIGLPPSAKEEVKRAEIERKAEEERKRAEIERKAEEERKRAEIERKAEEERKRAKADAERAEALNAQKKAEEARLKAEAAERAKAEARRVAEEAKAETGETDKREPPSAPLTPQTLRSATPELRQPSEHVSSEQSKTTAAVPWGIIMIAIAAAGIPFLLWLAVVLGAQNTTMQQQMQLWIFLAIVAAWVVCGCILTRKSDARRTDHR